MRKPVLLLAFLLGASLACAFALPAAAGTQTAQAPEKTYAGWAVGDSTDGYGTILHSTDSGATWTRQGSAQDIPDTNFSRAAAIDPLTCWVIGGISNGYGTILRTEDGGQTWMRQGSASEIPASEFFKISIVDRNTAWVVGTPAAILFTDDGGRTWTSKKTSNIPNILLQGVYALDANNVWVTGDIDNGYGTIFRTTDGGATWERKGSPSDVPNSALLDLPAVDEGSA